MPASARSSSTEEAFPSQNPHAMASSAVSVTTCVPSVRSGTAVEGLTMASAICGSRRHRHTVSPRSAEGTRPCASAVARIMERMKL
ncbi:MAG: hypothetical protein ACLUZZ_02045 [Alistipes inops]